MADYDKVGEGATYKPIREEAKKLISLFAPSGYTLGRQWGAGLVDVEPEEDGLHRVSITYPIVSKFEKDRNSIVAHSDLDLLRAMAISLLVYCEAQENDT